MDDSFRSGMNDSPPPRPSDPQWSSYVEEPLRIDDAENADWNESADVVVVGFGGAGVCAALEAREHGADVLAIDRFEGGGATALSGGVYYGGGTRIQKEAGFEDSPENMFNYLQLETQGVVSEETLRRFCGESAANLEWLIGHGVGFASTATTVKTTYPPEGTFLYYSGNELLTGYRDKAKPAPRGHRTVGSGFTGYAFYGALRASALHHGVRLLTHAPVTRLVLDRTGTVVGVEVRRIPPRTSAWKKHRRLIRLVNAILRFDPPRTVKAARDLETIERDGGTCQLIRARKGVVLSTGSFALNRGMMMQYAPKYFENMPLGTVGCDGSGIRLGQSVGGDVGQMHVVSPWRSIAPPISFVRGIIVDRQGKRVVPEDAYCGRIGYFIAEFHDNHAWLVIDRKLYREAFRDTVPGLGPKFVRWLQQGLPLLITLLFGVRKAHSLDGLARRCGIDAAGLERSIAEYNAGVAAGQDPAGKIEKYHHALDHGPYYAIDISGGDKMFPCPSIPMGGLRVDERTGLVKRADGSVVAGLYAAGRAAVGIPSKFYVSGTSIADCVFSGRRAGRSAAVASKGQQTADLRVVSA